MNITALREQQTDRLALRGWLKCFVNIAVLTSVYFTAGLVYQPIDPLVATLTICMVVVVVRFVLKHEGMRSELVAGLAAAATILAIILISASYNDPVVMLRLLSVGCIIVAIGDAHSLFKGRLGHKANDIDEPMGDFAYRKMSVANCILALFFLELSILAGANWTFLVIWAFYLLVIRQLMSLLYLRFWLNTHQQPDG
ncbi:MAG: hypothetical protein ACFB11_14450 [Paracoccaceae bacterium]